MDDSQHVTLVIPKQKNVVVQIVEMLICKYIFEKTVRKDPIPGSTESTRRNLSWSSGTAGAAIAKRFSEIESEFVTAAARASAAQEAARL